VRRDIKKGTQCWLKINTLIFISTIDNAYQNHYKKVRRGSPSRRDGGQTYVPLPY